MPSLAALRAKTAANPNSVSNGGAPASPDNAMQPIAPQNLVQIPAAAPLDLPVPMPQRGVFPANMVLASDRSDSTRVFRCSNTRSAVFQNPTNAQVAATVAATPTTTAMVAAAIQILVNNQQTPSQSILNFLTNGGITISSGANGQIIFSVPSGGSDGLTHGTLPWESDPGYVIYRDDFHANLTGIPNGSGVATGLGQLGWSLLGGSSAPNTGFFGGGGLHTGSISWENSATISGTGMLTLAPLNTSVASAPHASGTWALAENPGSVTTFVFKTDANNSGSSPAAFSTSQVSLYVGYTGTTFFENNQAVYSRPDVFMGVRYDTSPVIGPLTLTAVGAGTGVYTGTITNGGGNAFVGYTFTIAGFTHAANNGSFLCTASSSTSLTLANANSALETHAGTATRPAIGDSFYTLEVVCNPTYSQVGRNNTQGTTLVTNVAPTVGGWHRLDIFIGTAGTVTLTLDGSATNSLTTTIPTMTISDPTGLSITGSVNNDKGLISWTAGDTVPYSPWNDSSVITIAGFTSGRAALNGVQTLTASLSQRFSFNLVHGNVGGSSDNATLTGYPSFTPLAMFGNDDTGTVTGGATQPTAGTMSFYVDYFSFVQNANLGSTAPGTVVVTNSRYF
jgi:hypothetical protein